MANPQMEQGHVRIANTLWEAWSHIRVCGEAEQVLKVIVRQTWGYGKKSDMITLDKFASMTGLRKADVIRAVKKLVQMNLISKNANGKYAFEKNFDLWKPLAKKQIISNNANPISNIANNRLAIMQISTVEPKTIKKESKTLIKSNRHFVPPTLDEVKAYIVEKNLPVDPEAFFHHYEANGWVQGNRAKPVVKWKSCVHTWVKNASKFGEVKKAPIPTGAPSAAMLAAEKQMERIRLEKQGKVQ